MQKNEAKEAQFSIYRKFPNKGAVRQAQHGCALIWKAELKSFPTVYDNLYIFFNIGMSYTVGQLLPSSLRLGKKGVRPIWECALIGEFTVI